MSKKTTSSRQSLAQPIANQKEAIGIAGMVLTNKRTLTQVEAAALFHQAADALDAAFKRLDHNIVALGQAEVDLCEKTRVTAQQIKNYSNQAGEAMARIDKVLVSDFGTKVEELERFLVVVKELDAFAASGRLNRLIEAIK